MSLKTWLGTGAVAAVLAAGGLVAIPSTASADVACNSYGECWHVQRHYTEYPSGIGIQFYGDDWRRAHERDTHYHWMKDRDDDRGYYSHGEWHVFSK
jgi:hypothetical protein